MGRRMVLIETIIEPKWWRVWFGREGVDDYFMRFPDGRTVPWPTVEQIQQWEQDLLNEE